MKISSIIFLSLNILMTIIKKDFIYILMPLIVFISFISFQFILFIFEEIKRAREEKNKRSSDSYHSLWIYL